jgi:serine/threonine protein kinase
MWMFMKQVESNLNQYKFGRKIGTGTFGEVRIATRRNTGEDVAVKVVRESKADPQKLQREIALQRRQDHQHVVKIHEVVRDLTGNTYIVMELVSGGDLFDYVFQQARLSECEARRIFQQIIAGVEHCHAKGVVHRDLKPENIFMDSAKNVKIGDFGFAEEMVQGELLHTSCGSPDYVAPELLYKNCAYEGPEVDVWSCGVILYALLCRKLPFEADTLHELLQVVKRGTYDVPAFVADDARDLLARMLCLVPQQRISISAIRDHPWFAQDLPPELAKKSPVPEAGYIRKAGPVASVENAALQKSICSTKKDTRYDFGASALPHFCIHCGKPVLNRGCKSCEENVCRQCFANHNCPMRGILPNKLPCKLLPVQQQWQVISTSVWSRFVVFFVEGIDCFQSILRRWPRISQGCVSREIPS